MDTQVTLIHVNELTLSGDSEFVKRFNYNSELFQKAHDLSLTEAERKEYHKAWFEDRQRLEQGY